MFIIYINDIPEIYRIAKFILYADDANIIITGNSITEIEQKFSDLSKMLMEWVSANGLSLNILKKNYMIISSRKTKNIDMFKPRICNHPIEQASSARFLGVIIDDKLSWSKHITAIKAKMSRYIGLLYKLKCTLPLAARKTLFQSFVQSHVNYCSLVWGLTIKSNIEIVTWGM